VRSAHLIRDARSLCRVSRAVEELNRRLLRARDAMDRAYAEPLDVRAIAEVAHMSEAYFIRSFKLAFGETPHRYLQRRRVERAMFLLRETTRSITDICFDVGFMSLGTFSRTFREVVGETPSAYRDGHDPIDAPHCFQMAYTRPRVSAGVVARTAPGTASRTAPSTAPSTASSASRQSGSFGEAPASRGSLALAPFTSIHQERPA
jgi:AraC-like DNA-binding protein